MPNCIPYNLEITIKRASQTISENKFLLGVFKNRKTLPNNISTVIF